MILSGIRFALVSSSIFFVSSFACGSGQCQTDKPTENGAAQPGLGQDGGGTGGNRTLAANLASADKSTETVAFRLIDWKQVQFDQATQAEQHSATVEKLGCELRQAHQSGHFDVGYRCLEWKTLSLDNAEMAQRWRDWLKSAGFDVYTPDHAATASQGPEAVEFRRTEWKTLHGHGSPEQENFIKTLKDIGCEVRIAAHGNHSDIRYRAPLWRTIQVADSSKATQWVESLKQNGFEAQHKQ